MTFRYNFDQKSVGFEAKLCLIVAVDHGRNPELVLGAVELGREPLYGIPVHDQLPLVQGRSQAFDKKLTLWVCHHNYDVLEKIERRSKNGGVLLRGSFLCIFLALLL